MASKVTAFVIESKGTRRELLRVEERNNGDLLIIPKPADLYRDATTSTQSNKKNKIKSQHYSVHRSIESKENINVIRHTLLLEDGSNLGSTQHTKAVKSHTGITHIYSRRFSDLKDLKHDVAAPSRAKTIEIERFDSGKFTLVMAVGVCSKEENFDIGGALDFSVYELLTEHFRLLLIWSYIPLPAHHTSTFSTSSTFPVEEGLIPGWQEGIPADLFLGLCDWIRLSLLNEMTVTIEQSHGFSVSAQMEVVEIAGHFKSGTEAAWHARLEELHKQGKLYQLLAAVKRISERTSLPDGAD